MVNFTTIAPVIQEAITRLSGNKTEAVWTKRPKGYTSNLARCDVSIHLASSRQGDSFDEITWVAATEQSTALTGTLVAKRELVIQIKVEAQDDTDDGWAWATAERIRAGFELPSIQDFLRKSSVALIDTEDIQNFDIKRDGRLLSAAVFFAHFQANSCEALTGESLGFIETIGVTSHAQNAGGTDVSTNFTDATMPPAGAP